MDDRTLLVGVRIPRELVERLDAEAERQTRTRSNMIIHLLREALAQKPVPVAPAL